MPDLTLIVLAAEGADPDLQLLPALPELIWGFVGFALLFALISGRIFPQMNKALEERRASIQGRIEEAESQLAEAEETRRRYEEALSEARNEANKIVEDAKAQGEQLKADIVSKAEDEAAAIKARAASESEAEKARALEELRGQVASLSTDIASKIVGAEVDQSRHNEIVDSFISQLSSNN